MVKIGIIPWLECYFKNSPWHTLQVKPSLSDPLDEVYNVQTPLYSKPFPLQNHKNNQNHLDLLMHAKLLNKKWPYTIF